MLEMFTTSSSTRVFRRTPSFWDTSWRARLSPTKPQLEGRDSQVQRESGPYILIWGKDPPSGHGYLGV
jgi:hypothetical protein